MVTVVYLVKISNLKLRYLSLQIGQSHYKSYWARQIYLCQRGYKSKKSLVFTSRRYVLTQMVLHSSSVLNIGLFSLELVFHYSGHGLKNELA